MNRLGILLQNPMCSCRASSRHLKFSRSEPTTSSANFGCCSFQCHFVLSVQGFQTCCSVHAHPLNCGYLTAGGPVLYPGGRVPSQEFQCFHGFSHVISIPTDQGNFNLIRWPSIPGRRDDETRAYRPHDRTWPFLSNMQVRGNDSSDWLVHTCYAYPSCTSSPSDLFNLVLNSWCIVSPGGMFLY